MCFQKRKSAMVGFFFEKKPMTNKIKKFLYVLEHLSPDGHDEISTFALYHPLLKVGGHQITTLLQIHTVYCGGLCMETDCPQIQNLSLKL